MNWYEDDVRELETRLKNLPPVADTAASKPIVFYGSSSMRLWETLGKDFPETPVVNAGFGGSTLAACAWFFERLILPLAPKSIVFYAGDNDLGDGRHSEEVYLFFCALIEKLNNHLPGVPLTFLSIKISPARWNIAEAIRETNQLIADKVETLHGCRVIDTTTPLLDAAGRPRRELFQEDGLHLKPEGYRIWTQTVRQGRIA